MTEHEHAAKGKPETQPILDEVARGHISSLGRKSNMKVFGESIAILLLIVLVGCAPFKLEPLTSNHPAQPEASAAPEPPRSRTLAYTQADIPAALHVQAAPMDMKVDKMKDGHGSSAAAASAPETAVGEGSIVAVVPSSGQIVLAHGPIKGFMDAMTMGYRVESPVLLEGLKQGDKVRFTIAIEKKTIIKVEKLNR